LFGAPNILFDNSIIREHDKESSLLRTFFAGLIEWQPDADIEKRLTMATNPPSGDGHRNGAVKNRSQTQTPSGHYVKRDTDTGRFMDVKTSDKKPFKGVRREK
jgi:hypothetical protein|tara:strand:+ start:5460 stop:5768 length:309 start_codon:yes stop_codon:yes gene_type:complete